jgi:hypothetical protein
MKMRRGAKLDNNFAIFNSDVYANFLEIKLKAFEYFEELVRLYKDDCIGWGIFTMDNEEMKAERIRRREILFKESQPSKRATKINELRRGKKRKDEELSENKDLIIVRFGEKVSNPTSLMKVKINFLNKSKEFVQKFKIRRIENIGLNIHRDILRRPILQRK